MTRPATVHVGQQFGRLTVQEVYSHPTRRRRYCRGTCSCGVEVHAASDSLRAGKTSSCGCLQKERTSSANTAHGHLRTGVPTPTYRTWRSMLDRCENPKNVVYAKYGARGVKVCARWHAFENFLADMGERPFGKTLDRYPCNEGGYEPGNCRWATKTEQSHNYRNNVWITHEGETRTLTDWAQSVGLSAGALRGRLKLGWSMRRALTEPLHI